MTKNGLSISTHKLCENSQYASPPPSYLIREGAARERVTRSVGADKSMVLGVAVTASNGLASRGPTHANNTY
jgi:hypothetical protein